MTGMECRDWLLRASPLLRIPAGLLLRWADAQGPEGRWQAALTSDRRLGARVFRAGARDGAPAAWTLDGREPAPIVRRAQKASPRDAALAPLREFCRLHPIDRIVTEWSADGARPLGSWSLRLARPAPWTQFCATSLVKPFAPFCGLATQVLLDLAVAEVRFEGGQACLWLTSR